MITFRRLFSLVVPTSILGLTWFWWRWKNREDMEKLAGDTETEVNTVDEDIIEDVMNDLISECSGSVGSDDEIVEPQNPADEPVESISDTDDIPLEEVDLEELTVLYVADVDSENPDFESLESDEVSPLPSIEQLSVNCDQVHLDCDSEVSPIGSARRLHNQSSCGDSAIGDDYSSDALSITGSDVKSSEGEFSTPVKRVLTCEELEADTLSNHREWYGDAISAVAGMERPDKPRHWGSLPVSDTDSDTECIFKRTAKIGSVPLDKLSIQLTDELSSVKSQRENHNARQRRPRQNRRRDRGKPDAPKTPKKQPPPKKQPTPKKNESSRKQRRKSNNLCCPTPKKDEKSWRKEDVSTSNDEKPPTGKRETVEYEFPDDMCGRLIGKAGRHIAEFKETTGVDICIECELRGTNRIVSVTGISSQITKAAKMLNEKFHDNLKLVTYPDMEEIANNFSPILLEEDEYDVIVTAVVDVGNFYVQVYHQDVDEKLTNLQIDLCGIYVSPRQKYIYTNELPKVDDYCVSFVDNTWCRLKIMEVMVENRMVDAFFVDYGGNVSLSIERIWKIRPDMLQLKPQAVLCSLQDVYPYQGEEFSPEASNAFLQLINGNVLKAQVLSTSDDVPALRLSIYCEGGEVVSVSEQLHIWGLVDDRGIDLYGGESNEDSSNEDEMYEGDKTLTTRCFEEEGEIPSLINHSSAPFICAS